MKLFIFKNFSDTLNDHEKVFAWLLTTMWRNTESEGTVLTIHQQDLVRILYGAKPGAIFRLEALNEESELRHQLTFANFGDRVAIRFQPDVVRYMKRTGRRLGSHRISIENQQAKNIAIYLHAVINTIPELFTQEDFNIFHDDKGKKTRFSPEGDDFYKTHEVFRASNIFGT